MTLIDNQKYIKKYSGDHPEGFEPSAFHPEALFTTALLLFESLAVVTVWSISRIKYEVKEVL